MSRKQKGIDEMWEGISGHLKILTAENEMFREALESIAKNTCCDRCQEAALVARSALNKTVSSKIYSSMFPLWVSLAQGPSHNNPKAPSLPEEYSYRGQPHNEGGGTMTACFAEIRRQPS